MHNSGKFSGGGKIAVESSPLLIAEIDTNGRLGKVDGCFPHWVTPYVGDRYSLIYVSCSCSCQLLWLEKTVIGHHIIEGNVKVSIWNQFSSL